MSVSIIGMRGVGKTNIARRLSLCTKVPAVSTDLLVEYETGQPIPDYVAAEGWPAFRDRENEVLTKVAALSPVIVDCGGGLIVDLDDEGREILSERKVALLRSLGPVVWLQGDIGRLAAKMVGDPRRPQLDARSSAVELMARREPLYASVADLVMDVEGRRRADVTSDLVDRLRRAGALD